MNKETSLIQFKVSKWQQWHSFRADRKEFSSIIKCVLVLLGQEPSASLYCSFFSLPCSDLLSPSVIPYLKSSFLSPLWAFWFVWMSHALFLFMFYFVCCSYCSSHVPSPLLFLVLLLSTVSESLHYFLFLSTPRFTLTLCFVTVTNRAAQIEMFRWHRIHLCVYRICMHMHGEQSYSFS